MAHTGEVVGSIPTAPTIFQGFSQRLSEQTGTGRQQSAHSDVEPTWNIFGICSRAHQTKYVRSKERRAHNAETQRQR